MKIAVFDLDSLLFAIAYLCKDKTIEEACAAVDSRINTVANTCGATHSLMCLTEGRSFRKEDYPEYKANRKGLELPKHLNDLRTYVKTCGKYRCFVSPGYEADDLIFIARRTYAAMYPNVPCVLAINDKDCLQYPGDYINTKTLNQAFISEEEARENFWTQMIVGDVSDNVPGLQGIGPVGAKTILKDLAGQTEFAAIVFTSYIVKYGEFQGVTNFYKTYKTLKLRADDSLPVPLPKEVNYDLNRLSERGAEDIT